MELGEKYGLTTIKFDSLEECTNYVSQLRNFLLIIYSQGKMLSYFDPLEVIKVENQYRIIDSHPYTEEYYDTDRAYRFEDFTTKGEDGFQTMINYDAYYSPGKVESFSTYRTFKPKVIKKFAWSYYPLTDYLWISIEKIFFSIMNFLDFNGYVSKHTYSFDLENFVDFELRPTKQSLIDEIKARIGEEAYQKSQREIEQRNLERRRIVDLYHQGILTMEAKPPSNSTSFSDLIYSPRSVEEYGLLLKEASARGIEISDNYWITIKNAKAYNFEEIKLMGLKSLIRRAKIEVNPEESLEPVVKSKVLEMSQISITNGVDYFIPEKVLVLDYYTPYLIVIEGTLNGAPVVAKLNPSSEDNSYLQAGFKIWRDFKFRMKDIRASNDALIEGDAVIMEKLEPVSPEDDLNKMAHDLINQLQQFHQAGLVYYDLHRFNVMKKGQDFAFIDLDSVKIFPYPFPTDPGYTVVYPKNCGHEYSWEDFNMPANDMLNLGFLLNSILTETWRQSPESQRSVDPRIDRYIEYFAKYPNNQIIIDEDYDYARSCFS